MDQRFVYVRFFHSHGVAQSRFHRIGNEFLKAKLLCLACSLQYFMPYDVCVLNEWGAVQCSHETCDKILQQNPSPFIYVALLCAVLLDLIFR